MPPRKPCFLGVSCAHIFCQNQPITCKQVCSVSDKMHSLERQFIRTFLSINKTGTFYFELYLIISGHMGHLMCLSICNKEGEDYVYHRNTGEF